MQSASRRSALTMGGSVVGAWLASGVSVASEGLHDTSVSHSVEALRKAMIGADKGQLDALLAPGLSFGHSNGVVQTKAEFMGAVIGRKEVFKSIALSDHSSAVVGSTAIVRQVFASDIDLEGKPISVRLGELQIWQKNASKWRLIARQAFKT